MKIANNSTKEGREISTHMKVQTSYNGNPEGEEIYFLWGLGNLCRWHGIGERPKEQIWLRDKRMFMSFPLEPQPSSFYCISLTQPKKVLF